MAAEAYTIEALADEGPLTRTALFDAIRVGLLPAKKFGKRTIILADDWREFLRNLPDREVKANGQAT